ncbi:MAG: hypothetical protein Q9173_006427, partial [Seirophora scorigena]
MPPPRCHLTINAPSPTTIEYKVSTASSPETLYSYYCLHYLTVFVRVVLGVTLVCATLAKLSFAPSFVFLGWGFEFLDVQDVPWSRFGPVVAVVGFLIARRWHR